VKSFIHFTSLIAASVILSLSCANVALPEVKAAQAAAAGDTRSLTSTTGTITLFYATAWTSAYVHYNADGLGWTTAPGLALAASAHPGYDTAILSANKVTLAFNNGSGTWDNNGGANYTIAAPGTYTVINGAVYAGAPGITLYYLTGWNPATIDFAADNQAWTYKNLDSVPANPAYKVTTIDATVLQFALSNNRQGHWDNNVNVSAGTVNYFLKGPGIWKLENGKITAGAPYLKPGVTVSVAASQLWQDSGFAVGTGDTVTSVYASGNWSVNPWVGSYDAAGTSAYTAKDGYALPGANEGALIGRVGTTTFLLGDSGTVPAGLSGELYLIANDDLGGAYGSGYADNTGAVTVFISK